MSEVFAAIQSIPPLVRVGLAFIIIGLALAAVGLLREIYFWEEHGTPNEGATRKTTCEARDF
jgi:hypothetical protein